jgi:predicted nuclease with TOPRIM domain
MEPSDLPPAPSQPEIDLDQTFAEAEGLMQNFKQEYVRIKAAKEKLAQQQASGNSLEDELTRLKAKVENLELELAFRILDSFGDAAKEKLEALSEETFQQESFWKFVRFAGLGFVLGIVVKMLINK